MKNQGCSMVWAVRPVFSITTTITGTRIRMSAPTYAKDMLSKAVPTWQKIAIRLKALVFRMTREKVTYESKGK